VALSDEQNAMLRLLASGEQGYGDIAALLGLSEDEVRAKVVGALAQLQAEGKPAPDIPPPIAGGAKPAAEVAPPEPEPPAAEAPAAEPIQAEPTAPSAPAQPVGGANAASEPAAAKPAPAPLAQPTRPSSGSAPSGGRTITLPTGGKAWLLGGGVLAAIAVIVVVILLVSGGSSDNSSSTASTEGGSTTASENSGGEESAGTKEATQAELVAVDGSEAVGLATFGRLKNKLALQIEAKGLEATTSTDAYTIWLAQSPQKMLPLASTAVKGSGQGAGQIAAQFEVPVEILTYLASGTFDQIAITRTETKPLEASIKVATKNKTTPKYTGEEVLRGTIIGRIVGIAKREEEEQK
jgi:hypothetical protein